MRNPTHDMGNPADQRAAVKQRLAAKAGGKDATAGFEQLASQLNLHDLSEVPVEAGRIAPGMLFRCAKFDGIDAQDWKTLMDACNFGLVVDLRTSAEIPSQFGAFSRGAKSACAPCATVNLPVDGLGLLMPTWQRSFGPAWVRMRRKLWANPGPMFQKMYAAMVLDANNQQTLGRFFGLALTPRDGALAWHCAQGTDRTGVVCALMLEILGAQRADIVEHYAACYAHSTPDDPRPHLQAAYAAIEAAFGNVPTYLERALGVSPDQQEALRQRFLV